MSEEVKKEIQEPSDDVSKSMKEPVNYFGGILIILFALFALYGILQIPVVQEWMPYIKYYSCKALGWGLELAWVLIKCVIAYGILIWFYKRIVRITVNVCLEEISKFKK